ncbi:MAG: aldo/keto reductase [Anaerolineae bacterium]|jgi:predicted oxidoreductase
MIVSQIEIAPEGPRLSRLALGLWRLAAWELGEAGLSDLIHTALDLGITTFDHADIYGDYTCQQLFGRALALEPALRDRLQLVTKCGIKPISDRYPGRQVAHYDTGRAHILASVDHSLQALRTDYVDLLLIHRPDPLLDPDEVAAAFAELRQSGKVRHFGVSNFTPSQFELLASRLDLPLVTNQIELSVMHMAPLHDGTVDYCLQRRIAPMAWSPLGGGRLFHSQDEQALRLRRTLAEVGQELDGASIDQVALAWLLRHPARVVPVLGTGRAERLQRAARAGSLLLSRQQWFAIWTASAGHRVP